MFDFEFILNLIPIMMKYLSVTVKMSLLALIIGVTIALVIALIVDAKIPVLDKLSTLYISFFRGTPLVAQLFLIYFGLIKIIPALRELSNFNASVIVLGLNSSAYFAESIRGAISSIDKGQFEACSAFGMTYTQSMQRVILPQSIRVAIPAMTNTFADIVKGTSLAFTIGVTEIMATAQSEAAASYKYLEAFICVVVIYWIINLLIVFVQNKLENKLNSAY